MSNLDKTRIVAETADKLGVDSSTKAIASMAATFSPDLAVSILGVGVNAMLKQEAETQNPLKAPKGRYSRVEKKLIEVLTENTGAHFLDSGGAYGRAWQRNRSITDWNEIPETIIDADVWRHKDEETSEEKIEWNISITRNVFPYLANRLKLDKDTTQLNRLFERFSNKPEQKEEGWFYVMEAFGDYLKELYEDITVDSPFNTYNGDSTLSQTLQGITFELKGEYYVMLQIHGGCDVRGGYTKPHIFKCSSESGAPDFFFDEHDIYASCKCTDAMSDDCGYHWYVDGSTSDNEFQDRYKLPKDWMPKELEDHSPLVCFRCGEEVSFE